MTLIMRVAYFEICPCGGCFGAIHLPDGSLYSFMTKESGINTLCRLRLEEKVSLEEATHLRREIMCSDLCLDYKSLSEETDVPVDQLKSADRGIASLLLQDCAKGDSSDEAVN